MTMMEEASLTKTRKGNRDALSSSSQQQEQQQQSKGEEHHQQPVGDDGSTTHLSLAAMSTDEISSMGGDTQTTYYTGSSIATGRHHRKRKDDCSESRCTETSEEESRSRRRRYHHHRQSDVVDQAQSCRHRWLDRIDRKAATTRSNAPPIRPQRSADDSTGEASAASATVAAGAGPRPGLRYETGSLVAATPAGGGGATFGFNWSSSNNQSLSHTLPRLGTGLLGGAALLQPSASSHAMAASTLADATATVSSPTARDVARCQSMASSPPIRPTRTRDDSKTDLLEEDEADDDKNEFDPDMFARLLSGQQLPLSPPRLAQARSGGSQTSSADPPKKPRRRSDADAYLHTIDENKHNSNKQNNAKSGKNASSLRRYNTVASSHHSHHHHHHTNTTTTATRRTCPIKCQSMRDHCPHAISPKPPAKPFRTFDDRVDSTGSGSTENDGGSKALLNLANAPALPLMPIATGAAADKESTSTLKPAPRSSQHLDMSMSNQMDLEQVEEEEPRTSSRGKAEDEEDETEVSMPVSVTEYDQDLFARLLKGESCVEDNASGVIPSSTTTDFTADQGLPPPPLSARVSQSSATAAAAAATVAMATTSLLSVAPSYNRFDNSAPLPEHLEGAMKSSHPPMRPRRSFDEGMACRTKDTAVSLATAAAAACVAHAGAAAPTPAPVEPVRRRICIIGGKRRYYRRPKRRSTLALASELPSSSNREEAEGPTANEGSDEANDPTQEASLVVPPPPPFGEEEEEVLEERDEYEHRIDPSATATNDGSYQRILPARRHRRVVRRFTMPSKGPTLSPLNKKRRTIGRSLSCRSPEDGMATTPAA